MPSIETLDDLFQEQLQDMYYAEQQLAKALPKMAEKAQREELSNAFLKHEKETRDQIMKLEKVMKQLEIPVKGEKCEAITGIIKEAQQIMSDAEDGEAIDAALIAAGQKAEHYEIATYGSLCTFARQLGHEEEAEILNSILEQEKQTDEKLTQLAESGINEEAAGRSARNAGSEARI